MKYLVVEVGWEYNDETYYHPDSCEGDAVFVYDSEGPARAKAKVLNIEQLKRSDPEQIWLFFRDPTDSSEEKEYRNNVIEIFGSYSDTTLKQANPEQLQKFAEYLDSEGVYFFVVRSVPEGD